MGAGFHSQGQPWPEIPRGANTQDIILDLCRQVEALTRRVTAMQERGKVGLDGRRVITVNKNLAPGEFVTCAKDVDSSGGFVFPDTATMEEAVTRLANEMRKDHAD